VVELLRNPGQLAELKANPSLTPAFVEELCRYHTGSALALKRVAKVDVELGGKAWDFPFHVSTASETDWRAAD
jgi:fungal nitric oxide reductase